MAYGLKCYSANGDVVFDSSLMPRYLTTATSGAVTVGAGAYSATITASEVDYVYVYFDTSNFSFSDAKADKYAVTDQTTTSFRIYNNSGASITYNYVVFVR